MHALVIDQYLLFMTMMIMTSAGKPVVDKMMIYSLNDLLAYRMCTEILKRSEYLFLLKTFETLTLPVENVGRCFNKLIILKASEMLKKSLVSK